MNDHRDKLEAIIRAHTTQGSKHQSESLGMLDSHLSRFKCEIKNIACSRCRRDIEVVRWTDAGEVVDTWGYLECDSENVCHECLDEGYIGDIFKPRLAQTAEHIRSHLDSVDEVKDVRHLLSRLSHQEIAALATEVAAINHDPAGTEPIDPRAWRDLVLSSLRDIKQGMRAVKGMAHAVRNVLEIGRALAEARTKMVGEEFYNFVQRETSVDRKNAEAYLRGYGILTQAPPDYAEEGAAVYELLDWLKGDLTLQCASGSLLHHLLDDWHDRKLIQPPAERPFSYDEHNSALLDFAFHAFVVEHDWASPLDPSVLSEDAADCPLPYDHCCLEFVISSKRVCFLTSFLEQKAAYQHSAFVRLLNGRWIQTPLLQPESACLYRMLAHHRSAIAIMLDAEVARTEVVRAPHKLNRAREKRKRMPLFDYHVVRLDHRHRPRMLPPDSESERSGPRLHFRRGHWRHFETFKTWINWMLVGDPDLGFIDKHYRL